VGNEYNLRPQNLLNKKRINARYKSRGLRKLGVVSRTTPIIGLVVRMTVPMLGTPTTTTATSITTMTIRTTRTILSVASTSTHSAWLG